MATDVAPRPSFEAAWIPPASPDLTRPNPCNFQIVICGCQGLAAYCYGFGALRTSGGEFSEIAEQLRISIDAAAVESRVGVAEEDRSRDGVAVISLRFGVAVAEAERTDHSLLLNLVQLNTEKALTGD